jgi:hypothetical protein
VFLKHNQRGSSWGSADAYYARPNVREVGVPFGVGAGGISILFMST